METLVVELRGH